MVKAAGAGAMASIPPASFFDELPPQPAATSKPAKPRLAARSKRFEETFLEQVM
jgi:hypothetical protein